MMMFFFFLLNGEFFVRSRTRIGRYGDFFVCCLSFEKELNLFVCLFFKVIDFQFLMIPLLFLSSPSVQMKHKPSRKLVQRTQPASAELFIISGFKQIFDNVYSRSKLSTVASLNAPSISSPSLSTSIGSHFSASLRMCISQPSACFMQISTTQSFAMVRSLFLGSMF